MIAYQQRVRHFDSPWGEVLTRGDIILSGSGSVIDYLRSQPDALVADKLIVFFLNSSLELLEQRTEPLDIPAEAFGWRVRTGALMLGASGVLVVENRTSQSGWFGLVEARYRPLKRLLHETEISLADVLLIRGECVTSLSGVSRGTLGGGDSA